jgi:hypothetical protein
MGLLWHHLDRRVDFEVSRKAQGRKQCERVRGLANQRLTGEMRDEVLPPSMQPLARIRRNEIVHQDWVLRGRDAMRPVSDLTGIAPEDLPAYLTEWEREAKASQEWQWGPERRRRPSADLGRPPAGRAGALGRDRPCVRPHIHGRQLARNRHPSGLRALREPPESVRSGTAYGRAADARHPSPASSRVIPTYPGDPPTSKDDRASHHGPARQDRDPRSRSGHHRTRRPRLGHQRRVGPNRRGLTTRVYRELRKRRHLASFPLP